MRHSEALAIVRDSLRRVYGVEPSDDMVYGAASVAHLETGYGRFGQFGKMAGDGWFNWGAHETSKLPDGSCKPGTMPGSDVGGVCFYVFDNDDDAADDYIQILKRSGVPLDQGPEAQAAGMKRAGYYSGFHWAPGYQEFLSGDSRAIQESDAATAEAANIAEYASGLRQKQAYYRSGQDGDVGGPGPVRKGLASSWSPSGRSSGAGGWGLGLAAVLGFASLAAWRLGYADKASRALAPYASKVSARVSSSASRAMGTVRKAVMG